MKKRVAEKVISRSILLLAKYRKSTMGRALKRRPTFWTVPKRVDFRAASPAKKRLRLEFDAAKGGTEFSLSYEDSRLMATHRPSA